MFWVGVVCSTFWRDFTFVSDVEIGVLGDCKISFWVEDWLGVGVDICWLLGGSNAGFSGEKRCNLLWTLLLVKKKSD